MNSIIVSGGIIAKNGFVEKFILDFKIKPYNITTYSEPLKIAEAREIKKKLGVKTGGEKRLFLITSNPTIEAQNALLKTIEELEDETYFIFLENGELLPTLASRSKIVKVSQSTDKDQIIESELVKAVREKNLYKALLSIEREKDANYEEIMIHLRKALLDSVSKKNAEETLLVLNILKSMSKYYPLISSNNLNKRIVIEKILLKNLP